MRILNVMQILIVLCIVSCSGESVDIKTLKDFSVEFVYADGTEIPVGDCIVPNERYAIAIEGYKVKDLEDDVLNYSVNGIVYKTEFSEDERQLIPIILKEGQNTAKLIDVNKSAILYFPVQGDFQYVE